MRIGTGALLVASVVAGLGLVELGLRAFVPSPADLRTLFFHDDPHLNPDGDRALARVVADFVEAADLVAAPPRVMAIRAPNG